MSAPAACRSRFRLALLLWPCWSACQAVAPREEAPAPAEPSAQWQAVAAFGRAVRHRWEGDFAASEQELERAARLDPTSSRVQRELGRIRLLRDDLDGAVTALQTAVTLHPESIRGLEDLAEAYRRQHRHAEAIAALLRARALAPERTHTVYLLHALLLLNNRVQDGLDLFGGMVAGDFSHLPFAHEGLGDFLVRSGNPMEAEACYRRAIALGGLTRGLERKLRLAQERALATTDASSSASPDPGLRVPTTPAAPRESR